MMEDADLDAAVDTLMDGAMYNAGQCCCGIERIYVHESLYDSFVEKAVHFASAYKLGNPLDAGNNTRAHGPQALCGNRAGQQTARGDCHGSQGPWSIQSCLLQDDGGAYLAPQVLVNVDHSMDVMREESFGPVVGIMKVSSDVEALELMNDSQYGLTASLWTKDAERAGPDWCAILKPAPIFMNRADYLDPALCWTGCKNTGRGGSLSVIGFHNLTRPKSYHLKKA